MWMFFRSIVLDEPMQKHGIKAIGGSFL